ncbi:MAG: hypothetical protein F6J93_11040 [Oscillatoria sp. SIO1A7]|nr:hypothetical protein [Oscillatoria sp. SIO1A7]
MNSRGAMCPPSAYEGIQKRVIVESTKSKEERRKKTSPLCSSAYKKQGGAARPDPSLVQIAALARSLRNHSLRS